jgi:1,4-alpha-glucan branching enzyme
MRKARSGAHILFIVNATPVVRDNYRVGAPGEGWYEEVLNTDAQTYGGGNVGNFGGIHAEPISWQGQPCSLLLRLPPLGTVGLKWHAPAPQAE